MSRYYAGIGARGTPQHIQYRMTRFAERASGLVLRSGAAAGADTAFELGAGGREIWLPWLRFNGHSSPLIVTDGAIEIAEKFHPAWNRLANGVKKLHGRNVNILLGADLETPVEFVVCWTDGGAAIGGTGMGIRCANYYGIPVYNLANSDGYSLAVTHLQEIEDE